MSPEDITKLPTPETDAFFKEYSADRHSPAGLKMASIEQALAASIWALGLMLGYNADQGDDLEDELKAAEIYHAIRKQK